MIDITGKRYGRLTVLEFVGLDYNRTALWRCRCDCGNEIETTGSSLRCGYTRSCGCLMREVVAERNRARSTGKMDRLRREREERRIAREKEREEAIQKPVDKTSFDDWWMFGDHEADNQRWFESLVR